MLYPREDMTMRWIDVLPVLVLIALYVAQRVSRPQRGEPLDW
jgi:hypothetical protein